MSIEEIQDHRFSEEHAARLAVWLSEQETVTVPACSAPAKGFDEEEEEIGPDDLIVARRLPLPVCPPSLPNGLWFMAKSEYMRACMRAHQDGQMYVNEDSLSHLLRSHVPLARVCIIHLPAGWVDDFDVDDLVKPVKHMLYAWLGIHPKAFSLSVTRIVPVLRAEDMGVELIVSVDDGEDEEEEASC